jgi:hypothetical protein
MRRRPRIALGLALLLAVAMGGCQSVKCGPGTRLEKGLCVCDTVATAVAPPAVVAAAAAEAEPPPSDAKPDEEKLKGMARRLLARSEDAKYFTINSVSIGNTMTEGNALTVKVRYTVTGSAKIGFNLMRSDVIMGGPKHILPIGNVSRGKSYSGGFTMVLKKFDKGWDILSYQRD